jgi:UDP-N-acetylglucosamine--N-acetylmuramyl-(pentapeptide) pyrophosphoryl-undecaprenol N-acetylglucosamine transferase
MTIALVGGGSGGHITPILAVAAELKRAKPDIKLIYIGQKGDPIAAVPTASPLIDEAYLIQAGKFRRYHGVGMWQIFDIQTVLKNIRDFFLTLVGIGQSYRLLGRLKPAAIFTPGGFVGVPVGLAAHWHHVPFVTHDLDALPGLANRINARHAAIHAVAMPVELYPYPKDKTVYVGVPTAKDFVPVDMTLMHSYRKEVDLIQYDPVIFVIGGGQGAQRLNEAVKAVSSDLLARYPKLAIIHTAGGANEQAVTTAYDKLITATDRSRVVVKGFLNDVFRYSGAADVVITRAGATNMAEFAVQHKPIIVVPNPQLTGGHQVKNAEHLQQAGAISLVTEAEIASTDNAALLSAIQGLLDHKEVAAQLGQRLGTYANQNAAAELAKLILSVTGQGNAA